MRDDMYGKLGTWWQVGGRQEGGQEERDTDEEMASYFDPSRSPTRLVAATAAMAMENGMDDGKLQDALEKRA